MHFSRRRFFHRAAASSAAAASAFALTPQLFPLVAQEFPTLARKSQLKLGIVSYNIAKDWDVPTLIQLCTEAKFEGAELRTTHKHGVEVTLSKSQRAEIKKRFKDSPVELMGLGSAFDYHTPDAAKLRRDIDATKEYIVLAQDVGASGVKVRPNDLPKDVPVEKTLEQIGSSLRELGQFAHDHGQQIRLEVHGRGTSSLRHIRTIIDHAAHPAVGVCWNSNDTDLEGAGFEANFDLVSGRIFTVHLRDLHLEHYPYRALFARLKQSGYRGYCLAEIPNTESPSNKDAVRVLKYFRSLWLAYQDLL